MVEPRLGEVDHIRARRPVHRRAERRRPRPRPVIAEPSGDGTAPVTINGNNALFTGPGLGFLFGNVGRLVYLAAAGDPSTPLEILQSSGHQDASPFPAVCAALA